MIGMEIEWLVIHIQCIVHVCGCEMGRKETTEKIMDDANKEDKGGGRDDIWAIHLSIHINTVDRLTNTLPGAPSELGMLHLFAL